MSAVVSYATEHRFADSEALELALAQALAARLSEAIASRGHALLAVSGGRSPRPLFERLAAAPLDWSAITVTLVDERWLPPEHADSNARWLQETLLRGAAAAAHFVPLKNPAPTVEAGLATAEQAVRELALPFDVVLLGMGEDGHTASLFPAADGLAAALDAQGSALCAAIHPPAAPYPRLSLTVAALLQSRVLILPLAGSAKLETYARALGAGAVEEMPVRAVLRQLRVPVEVWLAER